jgi:hypothetical protein
MPKKCYIYFTFFILFTMKKNFIFIIFFLAVFANTVFSQVVVLKAGGTITNPAHWGNAPAGTTGTLSNFTADRTYSFTSNNSALTLSSTWSVSANSTVALGNGTTAFSLTLASGGFIGSSTVTTDQPRINVRNNATFIIQASDFPQFGPKTVPSAGSTIVYSTNAPDINPYASSFSNLIINDNVSIAANGFTIDRLLTINAGMQLTLNGRSMTTASISGSGEIVGDNSANVTLTGSGNTGTINFSPGNEELSNLTTASSSTLTLGTDLTLSYGLGSGNGLKLNSAKVNLNGKTLNVIDPTPIDFGTGEFIGSSASVININTTGSISGNLTMDATSNNLGGLILNGSGSSLGLGSALNIIDSVSVVDGTLFTNDLLTIKATSSKVGRISEMGAGGAISGNATVESFFAGATPGWGMIGSNGISGMTIADLDASIDMVCENCTYGVMSSGSYFESIQGWDEPACEYDTTFTASSALTPGQGFWVYLSNGYTMTTDMNWSFTGPVVQGPVSISCGAAGTGTACTIATTGYNIVANPYACPISWTEVYNLSGGTANFAGTSYRYERNTGNTPEWNAATGTPNNGGTDIIAAGQGFGVINIDGVGISHNIEFDETVKTHISGNPNQLMRSASKNGSITKPDYIHLRVTGQYDTDQSSVVLHNSATVGLDKYDSKKLFKTPGYGGGTAYYDHYTSISTLEKNTNTYLSTNTLPQSNTSYTLPVLVRVSTSGSYTIIAEDFENYSSCAVLRDKLTNVYTDLKLNSYVCNINDTTNTPRFELIVCESGGGSTSINDVYASQNVSIGQDQSGPVVKTFFGKPTDAVISVYNIIGQKLVADIKVNGTETTTHLDNLNLQNQLVIIKVTADNKSISKKLIID